MIQRKNTLWTLAALVGASLLLAGGAAADQVILDDLIVDGSECVGLDCVNGESFGFDTLRLKENNLRIRFQDTSSTASFPSNDWMLVANDSSNGGANRFSIEDVDNARVPFTIEAGSPSHCLYCDDGGRVGFGTSTPVVELHVVDGDTPTLRLEQDGSSGFTAQTWDLAGNETNLFIRDVSNGSKLPFRIRPNAPTSSIDIAASGAIGLGTTSPLEDLHLNRTDTSTTKFLISNSNATTQQVALVFDNDDTNAPDGWELRVNASGNFQITENGTGVQEFQINGVTGDVTINGSLSKGGGGFKIDHPLDPENRYLEHSFVESPVMLNIYDGRVELDGEGRAVVTLPEWFAALNRDYRYQLTPIGSPAPGLYVAREVSDGSFEIAGGNPGQAITWQLTGTRKDAWAEVHRIAVETWKPEEERGSYLHPAAIEALRERERAPRLASEVDAPARAAAPR